MNEELTTKNIAQVKRGDRFIIENIEEEEFQARAKALRDATLARFHRVGEHARYTSRVR